MKPSTTSTEADREQRRARHARRVSALRQQREQRQRPARVGPAALLDNPFNAVQRDREMAAVEAVFPC
jgi:hypothetical protein